jgi:ectoine hydroxylase-related dioxygenase (phytanoyl-CoA dioxygenase family)
MEPMMMVSVLVLSGREVAMPGTHNDCLIEKIVYEATQSLDRNGFAVLERVANTEEVAEIRTAVIQILRTPELKRRELGERGSSPQIVEIEDVFELSPGLQKCGFFPRAKEISAKLMMAPVEAHYDHIIFKPPMNMKETAWHQDAAYGPRLTFCSRRLHWWLPLHDVSEDQSCMRFVPGSHLSPVRRHVAAGPTSDALKTQLPEGAIVVACPLKEGSATIHLPNTLHSTGPNSTDKPRMALIIQYAVRTRLPRFAR